MAQWPWRASGAGVRQRRRSAVVCSVSARAKEGGEAEASEIESGREWRAYLPISTCWVGPMSAYDHHATVVDDTGRPRHERATPIHSTLNSTDSASSSN